MIDELFDELFDLLFGWVPDAVWGALVLVMGIALTIVGAGLFGESPADGGLFAGIGVLLVVGVVAAWYR